MQDTSPNTQSSSTSPTSLLGSQTQTAPPDYVHNQRKVNSLHTDGSKECFKERSLRLVDTLANLIRVDKLDHASFLDVGCRTGYVMDRMLTLFPSAQVTGVDIVPEFIEDASKVSEALVGDAHNLNFADAAFDWVFSAQTLEHCYDVPRAINECLRVAHVGCVLSLPLESQREFDLNPSHYAYTPRTKVWLDLICQDGWDLLYSVLLGTEFVAVVIRSALVYNDESGRLLNA